MTDQVDIFTPSPYLLHQKRSIATVCTHGFDEIYHPKIDPKQGKVLDFVIEGNNEHLIVPSECMLKIKVKLDGTSTRTDASNPPVPFTVSTGANVTLVNNMFYSLFEQVDVELCNQLITKSNRYSAYAAYIETITSITEQIEKTAGRLTGFAKDTYNYMHTAGTNNAGWAKRKSFFELDGNTTAELIGRPFSPIFFQDKLLPTQVSMRVTLTRNDDNFVIMGEAGSYSVQIISAELRVRKVSVDEAMKISYNNMLAENHPIPYFLKNNQILNYSLEIGSSNFSRDNIFLGRLPSQIVIGMVDTDAVRGHYAKNPFKFEPFDVSEISLFKDGAPYPIPPLKLNFSQNDVLEGYYAFMRALNGTAAFIAPNVTYTEFKSGYTLFPFDLSPDQMGGTQPGSLINANSSIRLEMKFRTPLPKNVTLFIFCQYDHLLEIHQDRRIHMNY